MTTFWSLLILVETAICLVNGQFAGESGFPMLDWEAVQPKAYLGDVPYTKNKTISSKAVDGVLPENPERNESYLQCAMTKTSYTQQKKFFTIDLNRPYLISSVKVYLRVSHTASWQNHLAVFIGAGNGTRLGNVQCGSPYIYDREKSKPNEAIFECKSPLTGRYIYIDRLGNTNLSHAKFGIQICEVQAWGKVTCGAPPSIAHASYHIESTLENATANYACNKGYKNDTRLSVSKCQKNGRWTQPNLTCIPVSCPKLRTKDRVIFDSDNFTYPNVIHFSCKPNMPFPSIIVGSKATACLSNGSWSHPFPKCSQIHCALKSADANRLRNHNVIFQLPNIIENKTRTFVSQNVTFFCKAGFKLHGNKAVSCLSTNPLSIKGVWSSAFPSCKAISCGEQQHLLGNFVKINSTGSNLNDTAFYACNEGYLPKTHHKFKCEKNESWTSVGKLTPCSPINCSKPQDPLYGYHKKSSNSYVYRSQIEYNCYKGYRLEGEKTHTCTATGQWSSKLLPTCTAMNCPKVPNIFDGKVTSFKGREVNDSAEFTCNNGYDLIGSEKIICNVKNGEAVWSSSFPTCMAKSCGKPSSLLNGIITGEDYFYPKRISFKCNRGFNLSGETSTWKCNEGGKWEDENEQNSEFPTCEPVNCGKPQDPLYGYHKKSSNSYAYRSQVEYNCYKGYRLEGEKTHICTATGQWSSKRPPTCTVMNCPKVPNVSYGQVTSLEGREVNDSAEFTCDNGYDLNGSERITCNDKNGEAVWSASFPTCKAKTCQNPGQSANRNINGNKYYYPNKITFECERGYELSSSKTTWKCNENGQWTDETGQQGTFPTCKPVNCGPPRRISDGRYEGDKFTFKNTVTYICSRGFKRNGTPTLECLDSASWSNDPPNCVALQCSFLSSPRNGEVSLSGLRVGSVAEFTCEPGYDVAVGERIVDKVILKCQQNREQESAEAQWNGSPPTCKPKNCGSLPGIEFGYIRFDPSTFYPGKAIYSCMEGYETKDGDAERSCGTDGVWDGVEPYCEHKCTRKDCPAFQECKIFDNAANCVCLEREKCPSDYSPVCGSDGRTYNNECLMKIAGCKSENPDIQVAKSGECKYGGVCLTEKPSPPEKNPCRGFFPRYYFDYKTESCERYLYGGCFEGHNSFTSKTDCEKTCLRDPCGFEKDSGRCVGNERRWYFNKSTQKCEWFIYTGCFGNENNFIDEEKCIYRCVNRTVPTLTPTTPTPSLEKCCSYTLQGNREICSQSKYVIVAKVKEKIKTSSSATTYSIKITEILKENRRKIQDYEELRISRKWAKDHFSRLESGKKYVIGGKSIWKDKAFHIESPNDYIRPYNSSKACNNS